MDNPADEVKPIHPASFSTEILDYVVAASLLPKTGTLLDPMAGIGRVHRLKTATLKTVGVEIEPEWAAAHPDTLCGNALALPFPDQHFDCVLTSPCYGNRMSDHHDAQDISRRRSYTHDLRRMTGDAERQLHPDNTGVLYAWQPAYWDFHKAIYGEIHRVLKRGRKFLLNVSDFFRDGEVVRAVKTHGILACELGFDLLEEHRMRTRRMRYGTNSELRASFEVVLEFVRL